MPDNSPTRNDTTNLAGHIERTRGLVLRAPEGCFRSMERGRVLETLGLVHELITQSLMADDLSTVYLYDLLGVTDQNDLAAGCEAVRTAIGAVQPDVLRDAVAALDACVSNQIDRLGSALPMVPNTGLLARLSTQHYALADRLRTLQLLDSAEHTALQAVLGPNDVNVAAGPAFAAAAQVPPSESGEGTDLASPHESTLLPLLVPRGKLGNLKIGAIDETEKAARKFTSDLLDEAARLEAAINTDGAAREITGSMVRDANTMTRRGFARRHRPPKLVAARLVALAGTASLGVGASNMGTGPGQAAFAVGLVVAAIAVSYEYVSESS